MNQIKQSILFSEYLITQIDKEQLNETIPLNVFVEEILKRSKTTFNILRIAQIYFLRFLNNKSEKKKWKINFYGNINTSS